MLETNRWFTRAPRGGSPADPASDEPSHIHIARPSRRRPDTPTASLDPAAGELRELGPAAAAVALQAA